MNNKKIEISKYKKLILTISEMPNIKILNKEEYLIIIGEPLFDIATIEEKYWNIWDIGYKLNENGFDSILLSDILQEDEIKNIELQSKEISKTWYLKGGSDFSYYEDISFGKSNEYSIQTIVMRRLKFALALQKLSEIEVEKPVELIIQRGTEEEYIIQASKLKYNIVENKFKRKNISKKIIKDKLLIILTSTANKFLTYFYRVRNYYISAKRSTSNIILLYDSALTRKILEEIVKVSSDEMQFILLSNSMRLIKKRSIIKNKNIKIQTYGMLKSDEFFYSHQILKVVENINVINFKINNVKLQSHVNEIIAIYINKKFAYFCDSVSEIRRIIKKHNIKSVLLPNDCEIQYRMTALISKKFFVNSFTIQHGYPITNVDENHLLSDYSFFWSQASADFYRDLGISEYSVKIIGCPIGYQKDKNNNTNRKCDKIRILVLTTGFPGVQGSIPENWPPRYINSIINLLLQSGIDISITIKLHPGESDYLYEKHIKNKYVLINKSKTLDELLVHCDIVISPPSTGILHALIHNKPVIYVDSHLSYNTRYDFSMLKNVFTIDNYSDINNFIKNYDQLIKYHDKNKLPVEVYCGKIDNLYVDRILKVLTETTYRLL
jgi:hypothetical protein